MSHLNIQQAWSAVHVRRYLKKLPANSQLGLHVLVDCGQLARLHAFLTCSLRQHVHTPAAWIAEVSAKSKT